MKSFEGLTPKEIARRKKQSREQSKRMAKKRKAGLRRYWAERRKEAEKKKKEQQKEKERLKKLAAKEHKKRKPRKKKTGPKINWNLRKRKKFLKKKRQEERLAERNKPYLYKIYMTRNGVRQSTVGQYKTIEDAYERFNQEKIRAQAVVFPRKTKVHDTLEKSIDECVLVGKTDSGPTMLRNEYGKLVEQRTDLEGWEIMDKFRCAVEETFWVWGYDNRAKSRKTFSWIYDNLLICGGFGLYEYRRVFTFRNKLLIRYDDMSLNFVICKTDSDAIHLYNELQNRAKKDGVKQLMFLGDKSERTEETKKLILELMKITGWSKKKVSMKSTSYMVKNLKK